MQQQQRKPVPRNPARSEKGPPFQPVGTVQTPEFLADIYYNTTLRRYLQPGTMLTAMVQKLPGIGCLRLTVLVTPKGKQGVELTHTLDEHRWANIPQALIAQLMLIQ